MNEATAKAIGVLCGLTAPEPDIDPEDVCTHGNDSFACQDCDRDEERRKNAEGECNRKPI